MPETLRIFRRDILGHCMDCTARAAWSAWNDSMPWARFLVVGAMRSHNFADRLAAVETDPMNDNTPRREECIAETTSPSATPRWVSACCTCSPFLVGMAGFYALSQCNYLLFHSLVELLAGIVAVAVFLLFRNARRFLKRQRESERKYRGLFEDSMDALMTIEPPSWKFTDGNPATVEMFRLKSVQELTTLGPGDLSPQRQPDGRDSGEKAREMIATGLREGSNFFEWTHRRIDGTEFPATVLMTRMEEAGKVVIQATVRDVTEQKRAEEVLRRHAATLQREYDSLQAVFDAAQVGLLLVNDRIEVVRINEMLTKIVGRNPADMLGYRPGDGFCCLNAVNSPAGCGSGEACSECPVRSSIARARCSQTKVRRRSRSPTLCRSTASPGSSGSWSAPRRSRSRALLTSCWRSPTSATASKPRTKHYATQVKWRQ